MSTPRARIPAAPLRSISCFSFTDVCARQPSKLKPIGGSLVTLT